MRLAMLGRGLAKDSTDRKTAYLGFLGSDMDQFEKNQPCHIKASFESDESRSSDKSTFFVY
jgi:hypothetical protein